MPNDRPDADRLERRPHVSKLSVVMNGRCCSWSLFRQLTGNDVSDLYFHHYFLFLPSLFFAVATFLIEGAVGSKNFLLKLTVAPKKQGVNTFPDPFGHLGPPSGPFGFCRLCGVAGGERVPQALLGWYFLNS